AKMPFLIKTELKRLYKRFGHPFVKRFWHMLNQINHRTNCNALQIINWICHHCQTTNSAPQRFKFMLKNNLLNAAGLTFTLARLIWYFTMQKPILLQTNSKQKQSFLELLAIKFL
ncbi:hypothetical protein GGTG_05267, partial [Gaeumannomyces tritici R3-111a-1]